MPQHHLTSTSVVMGPGSRFACPGRPEWIQLLVIASAAKQSILSLCGDMDCFAALAMTARHAFAFPPPVSREVWPAGSALRYRGRREDRVRAAPAVSRAKRGKKKRTRAYRFSGNIRPSLRNGFTAYNALSPVTGLSCHRRQRNRFRRLDASVGASGPHAFAVRFRRARPSHRRRPPQPAPRR